MLQRSYECYNSTPTDTLNAINTLVNKNGRVNVSIDFFFFRFAKLIKQKDLWTKNIGFLTNEIFTFAILIDIPLKGQVNKQNWIKLPL
jgi:hypothetical protein